LDISSCASSSIARADGRSSARPERNEAPS
jgi:hypothetical protein